MTPLRLLLLEDSQADAELTLHELRRAGYEPRYVRVEDEAGFRANLRPDLDLILADYHQPQFDARRALQILREQRQEIPFIIVSGAIGEEVAVAAVREGAADYVLKDRLGRLGTAVQNALEQRALRQREQKSAEELRRSQRIYEDLVNSLDGMVWEQSLPDRRLTFVSKKAEHMLGYPVERWLSEPGFWLAHIHADDRAEVAAYSDAVIARKGSGESQYRMIAADGRRLWVRDHYSVLVEKDRAVKLRGVLVDITSLKRTEEFTRLTAVVAEAANRASQISDVMQVGVDEICTSMGWPMGHVFMVSADQPGQLRDSGIWHLDDPSRFQDLRVMTETQPIRPDEGLVGLALSSGRMATFADLERISGLRRRELARAAGLKGGVAVPVRVGNDLVAILEFLLPVSIQKDPELAQALDQVALQLGRVIERERARRALEHQATHDSLTDLPNRVLLNDRLVDAIRAAKRARTSLALLLMDLDNFKEINDSFGHQSGDVMLCQVGPRLRDQLRPGDTVARLGGDEFAILLPGAGLVDAVGIAGAILKALEQPITVEGQLLDVHASVGIVAFPQHGVTAQDLVQRADVAMYVAKRSGNSYAVYSAEEDPYDAKRVVLMADLRQALERRELLIYYQPKVNLSTGRLVGLEALVRWDHPERGWVPPNEFIPLAEHTGLIKRLTTYVLEQVLQDLRAWQRSKTAVAVAINLSMRNLLDPMFAEELTQQLQAQGVDPKLVQLEITETAVMAEPARVLETMARLRQLGVRFAIDDFGTGYSSLAYLQKLQVQEIKIDRSFVAQMNKDQGSASIVRATIDLGHSLGLEVVAEGVEDAETHDLLLAYKCETAQGYLISRPLPAEEIERWLRHPVWHPNTPRGAKAA